MIIHIILQQRPFLLLYEKQRVLKLYEEYSNCMNSLANILSLYEPSSICMTVRKKWHPNLWISIWNNITQKSNRKEHGRWYTSVKSTINHQATSTTNDKEEKKKLIVHAGCCYRLEGAEWSWCYFRSCCCRKFWSAAASTSHALSFFGVGGCTVLMVGGHEGWVLVALLIVPVAVRRRFLRLYQWLLALPTDKAPGVLVTMLTTQEVGSEIMWVKASDSVL